MKGWIVAFLIVGTLLYLAASWPYLLGTWFAVSVMHAGLQSTERTVFGWILEAPWLLLIGSLTFVGLRALWLGNGSLPASPANGQLRDE